MIRTTRPAAVVAALALSLTGLTLTSAPAEAATTPTFASRNGITVHSVKPITSRTLELDLSTDAVDPSTTHARAIRVRVTLPKTYAGSGAKRYPTLFLFHGQDGSYSDWTKEDGTGGDLETIVGGRDLIVVTPEGGRAGWYTDWVNQSSGRQNWERFHTEQLVPFIDANLRTRADRDHRGVAGLSMGGFGAAHYATRHPQLFSYLGTFSGGIDLENQAIRTAVIGSTLLQRLSPGDGAFGPVVWPNDGNWIARNPVRNAVRAKGMTVSIYAGSHPHPIEANAGWSSYTFSNALTAAGVPNRWDMYGQPGQVGKYFCDGGHNFGCWNMALNKEMPRLMDALG
ncbi:alpha/beta hydrolase [Mariniluteicoccus flavus]